MLNKYAKVKATNEVSLFQGCFSSKIEKSLVMPVFQVLRGKGIFEGIFVRGKFVVRSW